MTLPTVLLTSIAGASTLPQVVSSLGLASASLSADQAIALLQAVADLRTAAALQTIGQQLATGAGVNQQFADAMKDSAAAMNRFVDDSESATLLPTPPADAQP